MNEPATSNLRLNVPARWTTEFAPPASKVTLCGLCPVHVQFTLAVLDESRVTVTDAGVKKLSPIVTAAVVAPPLPAIGARQRVCPPVSGPVETQHVLANNAPAVTNAVNCTAVCRVWPSLYYPGSTPKAFVAVKRYGAHRRAGWVGLPIADVELSA